jgi:hypothetical protein
MEDIKKSYTKDYFIEYRKRYKERFPDKAKDAHKEWYYKNKEKAKQNSLRYQEKLRNAKYFYHKYYDLINKLENVFTKEKQRFVDSGDNRKLDEEIEMCWNEVRDEWWSINIQDTYDENGMLQPIAEEKM